MKKYVVISAFNINYPNRGNSALCYGTLAFLQEHGFLHEGQEIVSFRFCYKFYKRKNRVVENEIISMDGQQWTLHRVPVFFIERWLLMNLGFSLPFTRFGKYLRNIEYIAADYGGDGCSDIYGDKLYMSRFTQTLPLKAAGIPLIVLPQTIGPFKKKENYDFCVSILKYARQIFVRDDKFEKELTKLGLKYERTKDLSAYMKPEPWDIEIKGNAIGINVSGLAYSNKFVGLEGQFDAYPELIDRLICKFCSIGNTVYLIPHSYDYEVPEKNNDDMLACRMAYEKAKSKGNIVFINKNLSSPQVKYVISKMKFFIGTRMHANFAAIYTNVPLFGLAYSYKFQGAFDNNGLNGKEQTAMINNLSIEGIDTIVNKVLEVYNKNCRNK